MWPKFDKGHDEIVVDGKLPLITAMVGAMQFSPNGKYLAVGDDDGNLLVRTNALGVDLCVN
jgi:WD40 repeat protein